MDTTATQQECEGYRLSHGERQDAGDEPDVMLDEAVVGNTSDPTSEGNPTDNR